MADYNGVRWSSLITVLLGICGLGGGSVGWGLNSISRQTEYNRTMLHQANDQWLTRWENHTNGHPTPADIARLIDRMESVLDRMDENGP